MSRVAPRSGQGFHSKRSGQAQVVHRKRQAGATALRVGLSKLSRRETPLRTRCDEEGSALGDLLFGIVYSAATGAAEQFGKLAVARLFDPPQQDLEFDLGELDAFVDQKLAKFARDNECTECECADCQCECHQSDEEE